MPRKSRELRLSQAKELIKAYDAACMSSDYRYRFIRDMSSRLEACRSLSKKQRDWLDSLIDEGVPAPKGDPMLIESIMSAAMLDGMQHRKGALNDFAGTIRRGYTLSAKQERFLSIMLSEAQDIRDHGKFRPADVEKLRNACKLLSRKGEWYWAHRRGTAKAWSKVRDWLDWNTRCAVIQDIESAGKEYILDNSSEPHIDEWACQKVINAAKTGLKQLADNRHEVGSLRYIRRNAVSVSAIIMTPPSIQDGNVMQDVLVGGEIITCATSEIRKRR